MSVVDPVGAAPESRRPHFLWLLFGACAAPIFWLGQLMLGYGFTAYACYPGDHPIAAARGPLFTMLIVFDAVALLACAAGAAVSWSAWRAAGGPASAHHMTRHKNEDRNRFLALWGMMSSLWFFGAILFNAIASVTVPPCPG